MNQYWHWHSGQNWSFLTCDLLERWQHGFFTKNFYPQTPRKTRFCMAT